MRAFVHRDTFHRTHEIFNGILGKNAKLVMHDSSRSFTDVESTIVVGMAQNPMRQVKGSLFECGHPAPGMTSAGGGVFGMMRAANSVGVCTVCGSRWAYCSLSHEWSHWAFGSNPKIAGTLSHRLARRYFPAHDEKVAAAEVMHIWNALDDIRCNSLWEEIYRGSADALWAKWKEISVKNREAATLDPALQAQQLSVSSQILDVGVGLVPAPDFGDLWGLVPLVRKKSPREALKLTHHIVKKYRDEIEKQLKQPPPQPQQPAKGKKGGAAAGSNGSAGRGVQAAQKGQDSPTIDTTIEGSMPFGDFEKDLAPGDLDQVEDAEDAAGAGNITTQLEAAPNQTSADMQQILDLLKTAPLPKLSSTRMELERETGCRIVSFFEANGELIEPLDADALARVEGLKKHILNIECRNRARLDSEGPEIDTEAYLQGRYDPENVNFFRTQSSSFGFLFALLLDKSASMKGRPFVGVQTAVAILREVLGPQPYVKGRYFWFWDDYNEADEVSEIHLIETDGTMHPNGGFGCTPLGSATRLMLESFDIEEDPTIEKLAVILTDGEPTDTDDPTKIRAEIDAARHKGMKVFTILVGMELDADLVEMFGPEEFIRCCGTGELEIEAAIEDIVLTGFLRYLRHKSR